MQLLFLKNFCVKRLNYIEYQDIHWQEKGLYVQGGPRIKPISNESASQNTNCANKSRVLSRSV